jgi:hypothetical protein
VKPSKTPKQNSFRMRPSLVHKSKYSDRGDQHHGPEPQHEIGKSPRQGFAALQRGNSVTNLASPEYIRLRAFTSMSCMQRIAHSLKSFSSTRNMEGTTARVILFRQRDDLGLKLVWDSRRRVRPPAALCLRPGPRRRQSLPRKRPLRASKLFCRRLRPSSSVIPRALGLCSAPSADPHRRPQS